MHDTVDNFDEAHWKTKSKCSTWRHFWVRFSSSSLQRSPSNHLIGWSLWVHSALLKFHTRRSSHLSKMAMPALLVFAVCSDVAEMHFGFGPSLFQSVLFLCPLLAASALRPSFLTCALPSVLWCVCVTLTADDLASNQHALSHANVEDLHTR